MYLKKNIDIAAFIKKADQCEGEVLLRTKWKDILNLKSTLCQYIFLVAVAHEDLIESAEIICEKKSDFSIIEEFLSSEK